MKVCIAGSRDIDNVELVMDLIDLGLSKLEITPTEIVSGTAKGVDKLGEIWAARHEIPIKQMPADWDATGRPQGRSATRPWPTTVMLRSSSGTRFPRDLSI